MNKELDFNTGVLVVGPLNNDKVYELNDQSGLYTLLIKGIENRKLINESTIINSITRAINTYRDYDVYLKAAESP